MRPPIVNCVSKLEIRREHLAHRSVYHRAFEICSEAARPGSVLGIVPKKMARVLPRKRLVHVRQEQPLLAGLCSARSIAARARACGGKFVEKGAAPSTSQEESEVRTCESACPGLTLALACVGPKWSKTL